MEPRFATWLSGTAPRTAGHDVPAPSATLAAGWRNLLRYVPVGDSLPREKLDELRSLRADWERRHPPPRSDQQLDELWRETFRRVDRWLDECAGSCHLRDTRASKIVTDALLYFDDQRYELGCYVVLPNHAHLVVRPFDADDEALSRITHSWKRHMSREINQLLGHLNMPSVANQPATLFSRQSTASDEPITSRTTISLFFKKLPGIVAPLQATVSRYSETVAGRSVMKRCRRIDATVSWQGVNRILESLHGVGTGRLTASSPSDRLPNVRRLTF